MATVEFVQLPMPPVARDYRVTFADGTEETWTDVTEARLDRAGVLELYRHERGEAKVHLVSLSLAAVRMWVKT